MRASRILQPGVGRDRRQWNRGVVINAVGVDGRGRRGVDDVGSRFGREFDVGVHRPRIAIEVLARPELGRIDEDARDHGTTQRAGEADQREMAFVERTHGGNEYSTFDGGEPVRRFDDLGSLHGWEVYARSFPARGWDLDR